MHPFQERKHFLGVLIITFLMVVIGLNAYHIPDQQMKQGRWVTHTHEVLICLETLSRHLANAESEQRGYLLTRQAVYLRPYSLALQRIDRDVIQVQQLTRDNPHQQVQVPLLREHIAVILTELEGAERTMHLRKYLSQDAALKDVLFRRSRTQMGVLQRQINQMRAEEQRLLEQRLANWQTAAEWTRWTFLGGVTLLYVLLGIVYVVMQKEAAHRKRLLTVERDAARIQREEAERLASVVDIQREVACSRHELSAVMHAITERTQEITRADGAVVELVEDDELVYRAASGTVAPYLGLRLKAATSLSGRCVRENAVLTCDDAETDARTDKAACRKIGVRSMIVVPLQHSERAIGVLKVMSSRANAFTAQDAATLELIAGVLSRTLSDAAATEALQKSQERLEAANEWLVDANTELETQILHVNEQGVELEAQKSELKTANALLETLATTDGLTGLKNRRAFEERLADEFQRAQRYTTPLSIVILDVDHFKSFNDTFGHPAGDAVLRQVAGLLQATGRTTDVVARYGGEEFVLLLPETDAQGALRTSERIRAAIADATWEQRAITVSVGAATLGAEVPTEQMLVDLADEALYVSKRQGRNRATHADELAAELTLSVDSPPMQDVRLQALRVVPGNPLAADTPLEEDALLLAYESSLKMLDEAAELPNGVIPMQAA